jgi:hypothetical protein
MKPTVSRRMFICSGAGSVAAVVTGTPSDRLRVGVIGLGRRGGLHVWGFARTPSVDVCTLCDVKPGSLDRFVALVSQKRARPPQRYADYRALLDRKDVDAVGIALPERLRSAAVHDALQAGKHVLLDPNGLLGLREGRALEQEARRYGSLIDVSQTYATLDASLASGGFRGGDFISMDGRLLVSGDPRSVLAQSFGGLDLARRGLECRLPSSVAAFELPGVSLAMAFRFPETKGRIASLDWEVRRQTSKAGTPAGSLLSISAQGVAGPNFAEWHMPEESDISFRPSRERFHAFAKAVRMRDPGLLLTPIAEARLTSALLRLGSIAAKLGRPLSFNPLRECLVGEDAAEERKLG